MSSSVVRKQYYFRPSERGLLAWDVDRLIVLSRDLPRKQVLLSAIEELGFVERAPDAADGRVMDGRHRIVRALLDGKHQVEAVQFERDPEPDFVGREPNELPY